MQADYVLLQRAGSMLLRSSARQDAYRWGGCDPLYDGHPFNVDGVSVRGHAKHLRIA